MKKFIILFTFSLFSFYSCEDNDGYTGDPKPSSVPLVDLNIQVSTSETSVVSSQNFPITIVLPKVFEEDVLVEVITFLGNTNKRSRRNFLLSKGSTTYEANMIAPSSDIPDLPFILNLEMYANSITTGPEATAPGFNGLQYIVKSNRVLLEYGDSGFSTTNSNRFSIRMYNEFPSVGLPNFNNLSWNIKRPDGSNVPIATSSSLPIFGTTNNSVSDVINFNSADVLDGTYIINVFATKLISSPSDLRFRFTLRFPNEDVRVLAGTLSQISVTPASGAIPKVQIVKTTDPNDSSANYVVTLI